MFAILYILRFALFHSVVILVIGTVISIISLTSKVTLHSGGEGGDPAGGR